MREISLIKKSKEDFPQGIIKEKFVIDCVAFSENYEKRNLHGGEITVLFDAVDY